MAERAHELDIARDLARKSIAVAAVLIVASAAVWGVEGALSSLYAVVLVVLNFLASAALISWGSARGGNALMVTVLGGYALRLGVLTVAILAVKDMAWVERPPLLITLLVTHLGLLLWETRSVSLSLAYPGLKPAVAHAGSTTKETTTR